MQVLVGGIPAVAEVSRRYDNTGNRCRRRQRVFVAELDGLFARDVLIRQIGSAGQTHHTTKGQGREQRAKKHTDLEMKFVLR